MTEKYSNFALISLSMGVSEEGLKDFVKQHDLQWPQVRIGVHSRVAYYYGVDGSAPHYILIGPDGRIVLIDEMDYGRLETAIANALQGKR